MKVEKWKAYYNNAGANCSMAFYFVSLNEIDKYAEKGSSVQIKFRKK